MTYHDNTMGPMRSTLTEVWPVAKVLELKDKVELPLFVAVLGNKSI